MPTQRRLASLGLTLMLAVAGSLTGALLGTSSPASAAVPGLVRVQGTSANDSSDFKSAVATCPTGKVVVGTGFVIGGAPASSGQIVIDDLRPNATTVTAGAYEADGFAGNWSLIAYAICANQPAGLVRISATSVSNSLDFKSVSANCPTGTTLLGTGFEVNGGLGEVVVDDFRPNGGTAAAPTSVLVGAYEAEPLAANWSLIAYGICANPLPGQVRAAIPSASNPSDMKQLFAFCPTGKVLTGTGFEVNGATGEVVIDFLQPSGGPTVTPSSVFVVGSEEDPLATNWSVTAYGICATA